MADQQKHKAEEATTAGLTIEQLQALIETMRKPYVDPEVTARNERARQRLRDQREEAEANKRLIEDSCSHMREDNTSRIAWIENFHRARGLYIKEGFCQACNKHYRPGVAGYEHIINVPVGKSGLVS